MGLLRNWLRGTIQHHRAPEQVGRFYVYELRYPDDSAFGWQAGKTFYVGKGTKDRILAHEKETRRILKSGMFMRLKHKHKVIISIWDAGHDIYQVIVYRTDDEYDAYMHESRLITGYGLENLTNATYGYNPNKRRRA